MEPQKTSNKYKWTTPQISKLDTRATLQKQFPGIPENYRGYNVGAGQTVDGS